MTNTPAASAAPLPDHVPPTEAELAFLQDLQRILTNGYLIDAPTLMLLRAHASAVADARMQELQTLLDELQNGDRVILPKTKEHARIMYLVAFDTLNRFEKEASRAPKTPVAATDSREEKGAT